MIHSGLLLEKGQDGGGNTGDYAGYDIRVKGDGRVEAINAEGKAAMFRNVADAKTWIDNPPDAWTPPPGPVVSSLTPNSTPVDTPVQVTINGSGFTVDSTVQGDGNGLVSAFVSATEMTVDIPGISVPGVLSITVTEAGIVSAPTPFEITA